MTVADDFVSRHRPPGGGAGAIRDRGYWSAYPESPRAYGEDGEATGRAAFDAYVGTSFPLHQPAPTGRWERSVAVRDRPQRVLPARDRDTVDALIAAAQAGMPAGATRARTSAPACAWRSSPA